MNGLKSEVHSLFSKLQEMNGQLGEFKRSNSDDNYEECRSEIVEKQLVSLDQQRRLLYLGIRNYLTDVMNEIEAMDVMEDVIRQAFTRTSLSEQNSSGPEKEMAADVESTAKQKP